MIARRLSCLAGMVLAPALVAGPASATCVDYARSLRWVAGVEGEREPRHLVVRDEVVFVLAYDDGETHLEVRDLTDPTAPLLLAELPLPGAPMDIVLDGSRLLVAALDAGLLVIDITIPSGPELRWVVPTPGEASAVAVLDDLIVVADGSAGLTTLTATAFEEPRLIVSLATVDRARGVALLGERVVVADGNGGLLIVDVTVPESPAVLAQLGTAGYARDVSIAENVACVADGTAGLSLYDLSVPHAPRWLSTGVLTDRAQRVSVTGSMAVVSDATGGAWLLDIADPTAPDLWGRVGTAGSVNSAFLDGSRLYVSDGLVGLQIYERGDRVRDPLAQLDTGRETLRVIRQGDLAVLGEASAITTVDVTSVEQPFRRGSLAVSGWIQDLDLSGDLVAAVDGSALWMVSVAIPDEPKILTRVPIKVGTPTGVALGDGHLYVTAGWGNTRVFDISQPRTPVGVAELETPGFNTDVVLDGHLAYVLDRHFGLHVFDVTDPLMAEEVSTLDILVRAERADLAGGRLCVAFRTLFGWPFGGLLVVDVSDPHAPRTAGQIFTPGVALDVVATDQFAYLADGWAGVQVVELAMRGPAELDLQMVGRIESAGPARGVALGQDGLLVAGGPVGLSAYAPQCGAATPVFLTEFTATLAVDRVVVRWTTAYPAPEVTFDLHRLELDAAADRRMNRLPIRSPQPFRYEDTDIEPGARYEYRLVATDTEGSRSYGPVVVRVPGPIVADIRVAPNPFTRSTRIVFDLPVAAPATLEIFDPGGRLVRTLLVDAPLRAGRHRVEWEGLDGRGRAVSPGVYTTRLRAGSTSVRGKVIRRQ